MFMFEEFLKKNSIGRASEYSPDKRKEIIGKFFKDNNFYFKEKSFAISLLAAFGGHDLSALING